MQYMLLINSGDAPATFNDLPEDQQSAILGEYMALSQDPACSDANQLQPPETAKTVRVKDGETLTTDGPFAETKEQLGGYYVIEADGLDRALEAAKRCPGAKGGTIEVRPVMVFE